MTIIRNATLDDIPQIMEVINDAKALLKSSGSLQWNTPDGYPNESYFIDDVKRNILYVTQTDDIISGVVAIDDIDDDNYKEIYDGAWLTNNSIYLAIHRIAVKKEFYHQGISNILVNKAIDLAKERNIKSVRGDTHALNIPMQKLLLKNGFKNCGKIKLLRTTVDNERLTFEKLI